MSAQISAYTFTESTEAYSAVVGANSTATGDDGSHNAIPIGFTFNFGGNNYTTFSINTNGFIRLGANVAGTSWTNNIGTASTQNPLIAAFWDDNNRNTGSIQYALIGSAPNQILEVGWDNINIGGGGSTSSTNFASFKIRLYETTNVIEIIYGSTMASAGALSASIGLSSSGGIQSVTPLVSSTCSNSVANNNITTTTDLLGKKYVFTPPAACTGVPTAGTASAPASACSGVNFNLTLAGYSSGVSGITFQWQSSSDGITYSNIPSATSSISSVSQTASTYYQCIVTCTSSGLSAISNAVNVTMNGFMSCYCTSSATSAADEDIFNVTFGSINNSSTCATTGGPGSTLNMYSDYTTLVTPASVTQTSTYPLSVQVGTCGGNFTNSVRVFIDYNQNGLFTDAGETVYTSAGGTVGPHTETANITIPLTAVPGTTKMRVIVVETGTPTGITPCGTYNWGETEDYLVDIITATPCSGAPSASTTVSSPSSVCSGVNFTLSLSTLYNTTGITYQWQSSPDGISYANIGGATSSSYVTNQTASTYYQCIVTCTNSSSSITSTPVQVNMNSFLTCYCTSNATSTADEDIFNVTLGSLNNSSTCATTGGTGSVLNQYSDYTALTAPNIAKTATYPLSIQIGTCGGSFTNSTRVFIDYNQNGLFTDPGETVYTSAAGTAGPHTETGNITIPGTAVTGTTRMRVVTVETGTPTGINPCGTYTWGETEDYFVNIVPLPANPPTPVQDPATPTCASGTNLSVPGSPAVGDAWYWQTTASGTSTATPVSGPYTVYLNGTYYVRTYNATYSIWSAGSDSVVVSNIPLAPLPPTPTAAASPACVSTTISVATPPAGTGYFWQGTTVNGTSTAQNASAAYTVNASGIYYVSAYDSLTSCWSNTNGVAVMIDTFVPQAPVASSNVTICEGSSSAIVSATVAASGSQIVSFGNNLQSPGPATPFNAIIPALPAGATITSTTLVIDSANAINGSWQSEMRFALSGATTLAATQISTNTTGGYVMPNPTSITVPNPPISGGAVTLTLSESFDDGGAGTTDATYVNIRLVITYTLPATTINWYNASTGGTLQGSGSPLETVGTSYLPNTNTPGTYMFFAEALSGSCPSTGRDTVSIIINPLPATLLNDTAVCSGSTYTIDAQNVGSTYLWNTGDTTQTIAVSLGGNYSVDITTAFGCTATDAMNLTLNSLPIVNLGADVAFCAGDSITLDAGNAGMTFLWNDAGASTSQTINAVTGAAYAVIVTNPLTSCSNSDTIVVTVNPNPVQNLGVDTTQCAGTITLDAGTGNYSYTWSDASTAQTLVASVSGTYSVMVVDTVTGCYRGDTVGVTINPLPVVDLGTDSIQCGGSIVLDAGNSGATYLWSDASTAQTLSATSSGSYNVVVTNTFNCSSTDTVNLTINFLPTVALGNDTSLCGGSITLNAGNPGMDYLWNNSTTNQTLTVFISGMYAVTATDTTTGCNSSDSINVTIGTVPVVDIGNDTIQCGGVITLNAQNTGATYLWSTSASTQTITVNSSGTYSVAVTNTDGCTTNDTVLVTIHTLPAVGLIPFSGPVCNDLTSFTLNNGTPPGGVYSGTSVVGNVFNPQAAGVGIHPITYTVTDTNGCSNSSTQNITVNNCIGIIENANVYEVNVYPNPTQGMFTLAINNGSIEELIVTIVDMQGKTIFTSRDKNIGNEFKKQIDLSDVSKGIYFIKLNTGSGVKVQKLIVE